MKGRFRVAVPFPLIVAGEKTGFWSRDPSAASHFVTVGALQAALLLQFAGGLQSAAEAAEALGIHHDENVDDLVKQYIRHGILAETASEELPFYRFHHPEIDENEFVCIVEPNAVDALTVESITRGLEDSGLVGQNVLAEGFAGSRGFAVKFQGAARSQVEHWLPWATPFLDRVFCANVEAFRQQGLANAFYLNALLLPAGRGTGLHIDRTMDGHTPASRVSVLYLRTVSPPGGRLILQKGIWPVGLINPSPGMLVQFRGDLSHGVTNTQSSDEERVSLVCEHYCLPEPLLGRCPYFEVIRYL
jgi:hypothetical protein